MIWQKLKRKFLPSRKTIHHHRHLRWLGHRLHDPRLWRWERPAIAGGVGLGLFAAFIPIPIQMVWGALLAFFFRVNLPTAIAITWINNPITFIPINFFIYKVGIWITGNKTIDFQMPTWEWGKKSFLAFWHEMSTWFPIMGKTYLIGLLTVCIGSAVLGYLLVDLVWRLCFLVRAVYRKLRLSKDD